jgi:hypothetical protein
MHNSESKYFGDTLLNLLEAAPILAAKYNEVAIKYAQFQEINDDEMAELLEMHVDPKEFNALIDSDFGQGLLVGKLLTLNDVSVYLESEEDSDDEEA